VAERMIRADMTIQKAESRKQKTESRSFQADALLKDARRFLAGGVNSPVRAFKQTKDEQIFLISERAAEVVAVNGKRYTDFIMGWGALIHGHRHPAIMRALHLALKDVMMPGLTHPAEVALAKRIIESVPSVEQVRFTVSGSEACMNAVRIARAFTKRSKILIFEGCYHGHADSLMAGQTSGIPEELAQQVVRVPYNNIEAFDEVIAEEGMSIACVIVEPVAANMGVVLPAKGFLEHLRNETRRQGILLIFDEVVTGFRLSAGGAQKHFGIRADLTTFGKIIGGGLPVGAFGGSCKLMSLLTPEGSVFHGGTFAGHPLSMLTGFESLKMLKSTSIYHRVEKLSAQLSEGLRRCAQRAGIQVQVNQIASMLTVFFTDKPIRNWHDAANTDMNQFAIWARSLREQGILIPPSPFEACFISTVHIKADINKFLKAADIAFKKVH